MLSGKSVITLAGNYFGRMESMPNFPLVINLNWLAVHGEPTNDPDRWRGNYGEFSIIVYRYPKGKDYWEINVMNMSTFIVEYWLWEDGRYEVQSLF